MSTTLKPLNPSTLKPLNPSSLEPLKEGWRWVRLGEVCEKFVNGGTPDTGTPTYWDGNIPWITGADVTSFWVSGGRKFITEDGLKNSATHLVPQNTVLVVTRTGVGKVGISANDLCFSQDITGIICGKEISSEYLARFILFQGNNLASIQRGATIKGVTRADIENLVIPLPPLPEQKHITSKLQELLQEVDRARTACKKQLEAAKALPAAYLRDVFESEEAKKWERKRLGEVCEFQYGSGLPERDRLDGSIPVFGSNGVVGYHNVPITQGSTIVIGRKGSIGQINYSEGPCWPIDTTYYIDASKTNCNLLWIYWLLKWLRLDLLNKATGIPGLNREDVYNQIIPIPPFSEQKGIAAELKTKMTESENLQSSIRNQLSALDALPQSILTKAFRGEL